MHRPGPMGRMLNYKGARGLGAALDRKTAVLRGRVRKIDRRGIPAPCPRVHDARAVCSLFLCFYSLPSCRFSQVIRAQRSQGGDHLQPYNCQRQTRTLTLIHFLVFWAVHGREDKRSCRNCNQRCQGLLVLDPITVAFLDQRW